MIYFEDISCISTYYIYTVYSKYIYIYIWNIHIIRLVSLIRTDYTVTVETESFLSRKYYNSKGAQCFVEKHQMSPKQHVKIQQRRMTKSTTSLLTNVPLHSQECMATQVSVDIYVQSLWPRKSSHQHGQCCSCRSGKPCLNPGVKEVRSQIWYVGLKYEKTRNRFSGETRFSEATTITSAQTKT